MKNKELENKLTELNKNNIALIGHMGSGKSSLGNFIAKKFDLEHIDTDNQIVKFEGKSISEIFNENGEKHFRLIEKKIISKLVKKKNVVLSLGGGSVLSSKTRKILKENTITIFLDVDLNVLEKRLKKSFNRPLIKNTNISKKIKELDIIRRKYYLMADIKVNITNQSFHSTCKNILEEFSKLNERKYTN